MEIIKKCRICGAVCQKPRKKYCSDACARKAELELHRSHHGSVPASPSFPPVPESERCPLDCAYLLSFPSRGDWPWHCGYILADGNGSRGCPVGPGCKRYKPKKGRTNGENRTA